MPMAALMPGGTSSCCECAWAVPVLAEVPDAAGPTAAAVVRGWFGVCRGRDADVTKTPPTDVLTAAVSRGARSLQVAVVCLAA